MSVVSITVNYKTAELALRAIEAVLHDLAGVGGHAIVVDNDSQDGSYERLMAAVRERGWSERVTVLASPVNVGFGAGNNIGFKHALAWPQPPRYFYLLNPDAKPDRGAVLELARFMGANPHVGLAGSRVRHEDGSLRISAFRFPSVLSELEAGIRLGLVSSLLARHRVWAPPPQTTQQVDWVSGASVMIRREVLETVGMFDETFFLYFEETDLCLRALRAGWPTYYVIESQAEHIGQVSTGMADPQKRRPQYWFDSRTHFWRKSYGPARLAAANAAFVGARSLYRLRCLLQRKPHEDPPEFFRDFIRNAFRD